jgi:hypothetical protein
MQPELYPDRLQTGQNRITPAATRRVYDVPEAQSKLNSASFLTFRVAVCHVYGVVVLHHTRGSMKGLGVSA